MRETVTSVNSIGSRPAELSIVRLTSARPSAGRLAVPAKMTSSIFCERTALGACAPNTHAIASTTLDLPDPLGPTTTVTPGSNWSVVGSANDLKPLRVSDFKNTAGPTLVASTPQPREPSAHPRSLINDLGATRRQTPESQRRFGAQILQKTAG